MLLVSHIVVASAISELPINFYLLLLISFISHFVLDMIPHAQALTDEGYRPNKYTYWVVILDVFFSLLFLFWITKLNGFNANLLLIVFVSIIPDLFDLTRYNKFFYKYFRFFYDSHDKIQNETWGFSGYINQILAIILAIVYILWLK